MPFDKSSGFKSHYTAEEFCLQEKNYMQDFSRTGQIHKYIIDKWILAGHISIAGFLFFRK